jgi:hypothetical protein
MGLPVIEGEGELEGEVEEGRAHVMVREAEGDESLVPSQRAGERGEQSSFPFQGVYL